MYNIKYFFKINILYYLTLTVSRIILFLQAVNNQIFNKLIILGKYRRCQNALRVNLYIVLRNPGVIMTILKITRFISILT